MHEFSDRPGWHDWALGIADAVATRADCRRDRVGAVILDQDNRVVGTGYAGVAAGRPGCLEGACPRGKLSPEELPHGAPYDLLGHPGYCISTHAEVNAILQAAGKLVGSTIYVTRQPCPSCVKIISNSPIVRVIYRNPDNGRLVVRLT